MVAKMNMSNLTVKFKMVMGYAIVLVCLVSVAISGLYGMSEANDTLKHVTEVNTVKMTLLEDMSNSVHIVSRVIRSLALITDQTIYDREFQKIIAARNEYDKAFTSLQGMPLDPRGKNFVDEIKKDMEVARAKNNQFLEMAKQNKDQSIVFLLADANPANAIWQDNIHSYINLQREKNKQDELIEAKEYSELRLVIVLFSVGAIVFSIAVGILITRSLLHQLGADPLYVRYIARQLATGDLTVNIDVGKAHPNSLISAINMMRNNIAEVVTNVAQGAETISNASKEISIGNADLSMRSQTQAGAIEETASSVEELTSTVKNNADNSRQANQLAASASDIAADGGGMVNEVIATMNSISDSSKKIVDIISVIDGIAFQTNILALNAAVEAARAGEQGRGFAVVASEVRSLAQRSAIAAKEIKILIGDSVERVDSGSRLVDAAGKTMNGNITSVKHVANIMSEITAAGQEQSTGIEEVNRAITQMDEMTQQNAALVEQAAAAAESMEEQAANLAHAVSAFKLGTQGSQVTINRGSTIRKVEARTDTSVLAETKGKLIKALGLHDR